MTTIQAKLQALRARIADTAQQFGRNPHDIKLLAVSKTWPASAVQQAIDAGQNAFAENYVQEACAKISVLNTPANTQHPPLEWHFIGPLQSNKARHVAENFAWMHSVDRLKIAAKLDSERPAHLPPLQVCLQVNISAERTKSGFFAEQVYNAAQEIQAFTHLKLRGLIAIPAVSHDFNEQRLAFARLRLLFEQLQDNGCALDTLSMGMSHDLEAAIAEGATCVRVGTAIFGERNTP